MGRSQKPVKLEHSILLTAADWIAEGRHVVMATLIGVAGSAPFEVGASMLVDRDLHIDGSVTGGCVEGALVEEAVGILTGAAPHVSTYGISDAAAADVGLMCGGTVHVLVNELDEGSHQAVEAIAGAIREGRETALTTVVEGDRSGAIAGLVDGELVGTLGSGGLDGAVKRDAIGALATARSMVRHYGREGQVMDDQVKVFIRSFASPPTLVIFGAIDFAAATARIAKPLGYEVTICDPREPFMRTRRFDAADHVVAEWPDRFLANLTLGPRDAVLVFTHDPKFDEPAVTAALASDVGYIGALGSRRAQADRRQRLLEAGVSESELDRVSAPCGLDIGARTPEETAVSIIAEVIARASGRAGEPLSETSDPIHDRSRDSEYAG